MKQEYSYTITVPLQDLDSVNAMLAEAKKKYTKIRISRKTDRNGCARIYISFPFSSARPDLDFLEWMKERGDQSWELFGPTYGRWGLC